MNIQLDRIDNWKPAALLARLNAAPGITVKDARVSCGGEHGAVVVFTTTENDRFTYTMPSAALAVRAVMKQVAADRVRFPLTLKYETKDRAHFERA